MESVSYLIPVPLQDEKPGLHRMIRQIQTRPGMYIGSNTLTSLEHFLDGYQAAERDFGVGMCRNGNLFPPDFYAFVPDGAIISSHIVMVMKKKR